jgi:hypothetical protein
LTREALVHTSSFLIIYISMLTGLTIMNNETCRSCNTNATACFFSCLEDQKKSAPKVLDGVYTSRYGTLEQSGIPFR